MTADVKTLKPHGVFPMHTLVEIANDPDILAVQIVCHWKPDKQYAKGYTTCAWTKGLTNQSMVFGAHALQLDTDQHVFPHRHNSDEINY